MLIQTLLWIGAGVVSMVVFASFFEWTLHRFVMHKNLKWFDYPFRTHAQVHHQIFKADETYHVSNDKDAEEIPMAWWNGPALVFLCTLAFVPVAMFTSWWWLLGSALGSGGYYCFYEYIHWCMHKPRERMVERNGLFFRLNGHHLLHHRYMHKNFNVVLPLADFCLGTLVPRSPIKFAQAKGRRVPDVQPLVVVADVGEKDAAA
ncbi:MAG: sterol desaturase family protein [Verrucomicrobiales bacterium]|nr:sterol desaturase family protein [Verrucomicrobiales bacterium]